MNDIKGEEPFIVDSDWVLHLVVLGEMNRVHHYTELPIQKISSTDLLMTSID